MQNICHETERETFINTSGRENPQRTEGLQRNILGKENVGTKVSTGING